jgi:hypothetical protein
LGLAHYRSGPWVATIDSELINPRAHSINSKAEGVERPIINSLLNNTYAECTLLKQVLFDRDKKSLLQSLYASIVLYSIRPHDNPPKFLFPAVAFSGNVYRLLQSKETHLAITHSQRK